MSYSKALIVDDSKIARVTLKKKLEQRGLKAVVAEDASQALQLLKTEVVDVVFMDHMMPGMDGFEATAQIKADAATAHLPVIMCSGKENEDYLEQARAIGASNILAKPADSEALDAVFAELEHSQLMASSANADASMAAAVAPASPAAPDASAEQAMQQLLRPLAGQVEALGERLNDLHKDIESQVAASGRAIQTLEDKQAAEQPVADEALRSEFTSLMDDRLSALYIPAAEDMQSQLKESLRAELNGDIESKMQSQLRAASEQLEASTTAQLSAQAWRKDMEIELNRRLADSGMATENSVTQQLDALREELRAAQQTSRAEALDLETLKLALREELMVELSYSQQVQAPQHSLLPLTLLTLGSSLAAAAAVALHFIL